MLTQQSSRWSGVRRPKLAARWRATGGLGYRESPLIGTRKFTYANISRHVEVGPSRHVLSQMVVAGLMFHQPPVQVYVETPPTDSRH